MDKSREYKALKNFVHNELGLSKEDFNSLIRIAIRDEAKAYVLRFFQKQDKDLIALTREEVKKEVIRIISGRSYSSDRDKFFKGLGEEVAKRLKITE